MDTGLDAVKTASKKVVHKAGESLGNKIAEGITKSNDDNIEKQQPVEEVITPLEKRRRNIKQIKKSVINIEYYKISKLLNGSTVSKLMTKNGSK